MIQSILSFCFPFTLLCAVTFGNETDTQGTGIVSTADKRICHNITWKLESHTVYVNLKHVLKKGDGGERQVKYDVLTSELVNITTTTDICCPGFFEKHKGKCKILSTIRTCGACKEFGNCSSELQCSEFSDLYDFDSSLKSDTWTIVSIVLSISVVEIVIAFVLGFIRFRKKTTTKEIQIASVIQSTNEVNNGGESIMAESSHEYLQMTDDCHSYNALNNNRAYVSMYNELNVTHEYTDAFTPNDNDRQNMHSDMVIETARHSVANDYETVD